MIEQPIPKGIPAESEGDHSQSLSSNQGPDHSQSLSSNQGPTQQIEKPSALQQLNDQHQHDHHDQQPKQGQPNEGHNSRQIREHASFPPKQGHHDHRHSNKSKQGQNPPTNHPAPGGIHPDHIALKRPSKAQQQLQASSTKQVERPRETNPIRRPSKDYSNCKQAVPTKLSSRHTTPVRARTTATASKQ
jgi:hypothetical protein